MNQPDGPLIVQSDKTLLLEVDHPDAEACRRAVAPFAELERAPEHVHTYRLTPLGLWNARAAGHDAEQVVDTLLKYSRYPVPHALLVDLAETMDRYGRLRLEKHPTHGLVLHASDVPVLEEVLRSKKVQPLVGTRVDIETVLVHPSERGHLKQVLLGSAGRRRTPRATSTARPTRSGSTTPTGTCGPTSTRPSRASGTAVPASSSCPAARARRWWAPPRWPGRRRPR
ncbi:hypothetical protein GCM10025868_16580 [Angustibacter aerolatus]|uniref:Helicase XPB/Ssl2 N-terminal domain-containing protein n=1 Tax=Angustibacter aerolatus TaxID=1162965 RepID=A0ABQ6JDZ8_9ACTN|nr:helicase-associated domain-containing protein [Angustibacter aerolatus]GMA86408.1 hypothetical protein GCM10025868_16580 [Angustibacter aerolatus]